MQVETGAIDWHNSQKFVTTFKDLTKMEQLIQIFFHNLTLLYL